MSNLKPIATRGLVLNNNLIVTLMTNCRGWNTLEDFTARPALDFVQDTTDRRVSRLFELAWALSATDRAKKEDLRGLSYDEFLDLLPHYEELKERLDALLGEAFPRKCPACSKKVASNLDICPSCETHIPEYLKSLPPLGKSRG